MTFPEILLIAIGLSMDAFAVSLGAGAAGRDMGGRAAFRLSFHFGLFQFMMPVAGWFLGAHVVAYFAAFDHWIAFGLLSIVGVRMIRAGFDPRFATWRGDPSRGWTLVMLSLATSIDALAVGLTLAVLGIAIWYPSVVIGLVTGGLSLTGVRIGSRLGRTLGTRMEIAGGVLLLAIGLRILYVHLTG
jgi:putative Mn2+ efflux pump MntP